MATDEEVLAAEAVRLEDEYHTAHAAVAAAAEGTVEWDAAQRRFEAAQDALRAARAHWRAIGEAVDPTHPGHRSGVKVASNDGSVTA